MARDNHPRHRQARALARKAPKRPPFDRVLIVTEGTKTECQYLDDIRKQKRVPSVHVAIMPSGFGTQPRQVVDFAEVEFKRTKGFERVYAVFDRDSHTTYADALAQAARLNGALKNDEGKKVEFLAIPSVPCFELWLLIHYEDVFAFTDRHEVIGKVGSRLSGYTKGATGILAKTEAMLDGATRRAEALRQRFAALPGDDPYTDMDKVVERLRAIRR